MGNLESIGDEEELQEGVDPGDLPGMMLEPEEVVAVDDDGKAEFVPPLPEINPDDIENIMTKAKDFSEERGEAKELPVTEPVISQVEEVKVEPEPEPKPEEQSKNFEIEDFEEQKSMGGGIAEFEDPMVQLGFKDNEEIGPTGFFDDAEKRIAENKARIEFLNKAAQEGKLSENYKFARNSEELAEQEMVKLEAEIRELENNSRAFKNEPPTPTPAPEIPEYALEKKTTPGKVYEETIEIGKKVGDSVKEEKIEVDPAKKEDKQEKETAGDKDKESNETQENRENFLEPPLKSFSDLYRAIIDHGDLEDSGKKYSPQELIYSIGKFYKEEGKLSDIPEAKGLRKAVLLIMANELNNPQVIPSLEGSEGGGGVPTNSEGIISGSEGQEGDGGGGTEGEFEEVDGEEQEPSIGDGAAAAAREAFDSADAQNPLEQNQEKKGGRWWGWFKERAKGLLTFGFWEVHQAEKVRMAGKKAEQEILQGAGYMKKEQNLSYDDAWAEAEKMQELLGASGESLDGLLPEEVRERYGELSEAITERKVIANQQIEDEIVNRSIAEVEKRMAGYKKYDGEKMEMTPDKKLSPEKRAEIEQKIRGGLGAIRQGQVEKDMIKFGKMVRGSLDKNWYKRYVAGGIEAALGFAGVKWLVVPAIDSYAKAKAGTAAKEAATQTRRVISTIKETATSGSPVGDVGTTAKEVAGGLNMAQEQVIPQVYQGLSQATGEVAGQAGETAVEATKSLQGNLWNMAKGLLGEKGVVNPTQGQIMDVTKQLAADNSVAIEKWGMAGKVLDTKMPVGMVIKIGGAALKAASLATKVAGL